MALVRLYPHNPKMGFVLHTYTLTEEGIRFLGKRGWYEVTDEVAELLRDVPQQDRHPRGPKAFMIAADAAEARVMDDDLKSLLNQEEQEIGTAEAPVQALRPGQRAEKAKTRRKSARSTQAGE